jgi:hypothetical protein
MIFSHLFLSNSIKNYNNSKIWSENSTDSHNNIFWIHNHLVKVSNDFNKVILHIFHNLEHISLSYIGVREPYMPLWGCSTTLFVEITWIFYVTLKQQNHVLRNVIDFSSHFMIFSHLFLSNSINNYRNSETWSENSIASHNNIFWLHNNLIKVSNDFNKKILYIFHN